MSRKEIVELIDKVDSTPGWRVDKIDGSRYKITPPHPHGLIHVSESGDPHALYNVKTLLRRAGFYHRADPNMNKPATPPRLPPPPLVASAEPSPPIQCIRDDIEVIMTCLARISDNLSRVEDEQQGMQQLKKLISTVLK